MTLSLDDAAVLRSGDPSLPLVVLLHGYGSDERDLFALRSRLPEQFSYAAVRAPLTPPFPQGGWSWYPIEGLASRDPAAVTAAAEALLAWLPEEAVGLVGFSQGGAVSLQAMRLAPERFDFVVNLSGYWAGGSLPGDAALAEAPVPVFWGRGADDAVVPAEAVTLTTLELPPHSALAGRVYPGLGHAVSDEELADLAAFLRRQA
ncbi:alpha/beta hydrolase [Microbacterium indicum]|uniref:alpha/beta hydrolase n=1 Tax=Microbacterium indicum TaxID=358100 RepID=UPI0004160518|nr:alpha/beta hydrolase-fold protein [Microbacterium indicum]